MDPFHVKWKIKDETQNKDSYARIMFGVTQQERAGTHLAMGWS